MVTILTTPAEISNTLRSAIRRYAYLRWSVAWASSGFPLFEELLKNRDRVAQLVVGTHFYQTHPDFLNVFVDDPKVHVVPFTSGVFHPKIYLFENSRDDWACMIGSPNFTGAAFSGNVEVAVYMDSSVSESNVDYETLRRVIDEHWGRATPLTREFLETYRSIWNRKVQLLGNLSGTYGGNAGKPIVSVGLLKLSWPGFVDRVRNEKQHTLGMRISVLRGVRTYFQAKKHLTEMGKDERRRIAGLAGEDQGVDWGYFGSMRGAGWFQKAINGNDKNLSAALDAIPSDGLVAQDDYDAFIESFKKATRSEANVAVATRLLCMKRPDMFVCLDNKNRSGLCKAFGVIQSGMSYARYRNEIIERVRDAVWWNAPRPSDSEEQEVWLGRTAFLDALYYEE
jgi:HKD family nuclease